MKTTMGSRTSSLGRRAAVLTVASMLFATIPAALAAEGGGAGPAAGSPTAAPQQVQPSGGNPAAPNDSESSDPGRVGKPNATPSPLASPAVAAAGPALEVTDLTSGDPAALASTLVGNGVTVSNTTYTGSGDSGGTFTGGSTAVGFDTGVVLGSGSVQTHEGDDICNKGIEGPNECSGNTTNLGLTGDDALTELAGFPTYDATVLEFDFVPTYSSISFQYVFSSDEYREYANTMFNDTFAFFVNGTNCATVPTTGEPVSVNTINNGNPDGDTTSHNPELYVDNPADAPSRDIEMDGLTVVLSCSAAVTAGATNHMKLAIADGSDSVLDSNVFIQAGSFVSEPPSCGEDGLAVLATSGVASGTVHDVVEPLLADPNVTAIIPGLAEQVHDVNCSTVVPLEDTVDTAVEGALASLGL